MEIWKLTDLSEKNLKHKNPLNYFPTTIVWLWDRSTKFNFPKSKPVPSDIILFNLRTMKPMTYVQEARAMNSRSVLTFCWLATHTIKMLHQDPANLKRVSDQQSVSTSMSVIADILWIIRIRITNDLLARRNLLWDILRLQSSPRGAAAEQH